MTHQPCNCIAEINGKLEEHTLDTSIVISRDLNAMTSQTYTALHRKDNGRAETRSSKPRLFAHKFCPFCGDRYEPNAAKPSIYERLFNADVRIEAMWPFPVSPAPEKLGDLFEYADDEQDLPEPLRDLIRSLDERSRDELYNGGSQDFQEAFSELCGAAFRKGLHGWLGIAACPVPKPSAAGGLTFSWGYYSTRVLFADTAEGLLEAAAAWGEAEFAAAHAQAEGGAAA